MPIQTTRWEVAEHLDGPEIIAEYLSAAIEEGGTAMLRSALKDVATARGLALIAAEIGVTRDELLGALTHNGDDAECRLRSIVEMVAASTRRAQP